VNHGNRLIATMAMLAAMGCSAGAVTPDEGGAGFAAGAAGTGSAGLAGGAAGTRGAAGASGSAGAAGVAGNPRPGIAGNGGAGSGAAGNGIAGNGGAGGAAATAVGFVSVVSVATAMMPGYQARAGFYTGEECAYREIGPCGIVSCTGAAVAADAGSITITGGAEPVTLASAAAAYTPVMGTRALWQGGEALTIAAAGSATGVPAFQATVTAPPGVMLTGLGAAAWPGEAQVTPAPRTTPITVRWSSQAMQVSVDLYGAQGGASCTFPGFGGTGTIPAEVLALIPPGEAELSVASLGLEQLVAGRFVVDLALVSLATTAAGGAGFAILTLQ
jgi:hypothetical protein